MLMHALHVNPLTRTGDAMPALRAADRFFFIPARLIFTVRALLSPAFREWNAQAVTGICPINVLANHAGPCSGLKIRILSGGRTILMELGLPLQGICISQYAAAVSPVASPIMR